MGMILTADAGNSNIELGCFKEDTLAASGRIETHRSWTPESMTQAITDVLSASSFLPGADFLRGHPDNRDNPDGKNREGICIEGSVISSVVPEINPILSAALVHITGRKPLLMSPSLKTGIRTDLYDVSLLGADRVADMAAAAFYYGTPAAVWDLGTCTTLSVVDQDACFIGGMISAGVQLSLDVQADRTAQLPRLKAAGTDRLLGLDTISNMISGSSAAAGIQIEGVAARIRETYHLPNLQVILTGGNAEYVLPWIREPVVHDSSLLLKGLFVIYRMNCVSA